MLKVTREQIKLLKKYIPKIEEYVETDNIYDLQLELDQAILDYGFVNQDYLNEVGRELQRAYDIIHIENS